MKKLLILVAIITLPLIAYFNYADWKRYNPSTDYAYPIADGIDMNYYQAEWVKEYFENAVEIGRFAREKYRSEDLDVRYPDNQNTEELTASKYYHSLIARNKFLEGKLKFSSELKENGLTNQDVKLVMEQGMSVKYLKEYKTSASYITLKLGDVGAEVWNVQKELLSKGYQLPLDGTFGIETQRQLVAFQEKNEIYPSGNLDKDTFILLFNE